MQIEIVYGADNEIVCCYCGVFLTDDMDSEDCICEDCWNKYYSKAGRYEKSEELPLIPEGRKYHTPVKPADDPHNPQFSIDGIQGERR